jgi:hypothetical protein
MGGAFIGMADDPSAVDANPAGIATIPGGVVFEGRRLAYNATLAGGGIVGSPTTGFPNAIDVSASRQTLSFAAVVLPFGHLGVAAFYNAPVAYRLRGAIPKFGGAIVSGQLAGELPGDFGIDFEERTAGVAAAWNFGRIAVGIVSRYDTLAPHGHEDYYGYETNPASPSYLGRLPDAYVYTLASDSKSSSVTGGVSAKLVVLPGRLTMGFVYNRGGRFVLRSCQTNLTGSCAISAASGITRSRLALPDQYGIGISGQPRPTITINLDVKRVTYSKLLNGFVPLAPCAIVDCSNSNPSDLGYGIRDVTETHVGIEWRVTNTPLALHAGVWRDPAHGMTLAPGQVVTAPSGKSAAATALMRYAETRFATPGESLTHVSIGAGYRGPIEIDFGYDRSALTQTLAFSIVRTFSWTPRHTTEK